MRSEELAKEQPAQITLCGSDRVTVAYLAAGEREIFESAMLGLSWIRRGANGRIETMAAVQALKGPAEDEAMLPFWRPLPKKSDAAGYQLELFEFDELHPQSSPSITIQHLCGYDYTPENYRNAAKTLEEFGFECLRSQRGADGKYWEIWFLSGLFAAKGALREEIVRLKRKWALPSWKDSDPRLLEALPRFIWKHCYFGTLDMSFQRLAMSIPD